jgi:SAM-dependent methyltransferase
MKPAAEFDSFASSYESELGQALSISGEGQDYFARGRIGWLAKCLRDQGAKPRSAMDYGCGIGGTSVLLRDLVAVESVVGLDPSVRSLEVARSRHSNLGIRFLSLEDYSPCEDIDVAYCNGVFHHIPVAERGQAAKYILHCLRPGGFFALWENNPWNLGARWVMSQCAFDRDAVALTPPEAAGLLRAEGFEVLCTNYLFIFPRFLKSLRFLEPRFSRFPGGAQYMVLSRRPVPEDRPAS